MNPLLEGVLQESGARIARRWAAGLIAGLCAGAAAAAPIQYTLLVDGGITAGTIGSNTFTQGIATLQFTGDTADVLPYTVSNAPDPGSTSGYILLKGEATIDIYDLANGASYSATFLPGAGIFVSTDNTHFSVGFGSFGVPPGSSGFPGLPVYPEGMLGTTGPLSTYDLKSDLSGVSGYSISDAGFPGFTAVGPALPTTAGDLVLNEQGISYSTFQAQFISAYPFASLSAMAYAKSRANGRFALGGALTFATGSNGFNYSTDALTLQFGPYSVTLPAGSLAPGEEAAGSLAPGEEAAASLASGEEGALRFSGIVAGTQLQVRLYPNRAGNGYRFHISASGVNLTGLGKLARLQLGLGDNTGSISVGVHSYDD
jgi:hypothetical protein